MEERLQRLELEVERLKVAVNELREMLLRIEEELRDLRVSMTYWIFG